MSPSVSEAVEIDIAKLGSKATGSVALEALARSLAARIDQGDKAGMALPALSKELRLVLAQLAESDTSDEYDRFLSELRA